MKRIFCKVALWVLDRLLGAIKDDQSDLTDLPDQASLKQGKDFPSAMDWKDAVRDFPVAVMPRVIVAQAAEHVPGASVEAVLFGGPADGWVEKIPAGKPWPKVLLFRVGAEAHAYEMVEGRAVFRHVRQVGWFLGKSENLKG